MDSNVYKIAIKNKAWSESARMASAEARRGSKSESKPGFKEKTLFEKNGPPTTDDAAVDVWTQSHVSNLEVATEETSSIRSYQDNSDSVNTVLRAEGPIYSTATNERIKTLDEVINKSSVDVDTVVYRGMKLEMNMKPGDVFEDKGYMSTSFNRNMAIAFSKNNISDSTDPSVVMRIRVPKDSAILSVNNALGGHSRFMSEQEGVFPRGTKLRFLGIDKSIKNSNITNWRKLDEYVFELVK